MQGDDATGEIPPLHLPPASVLDQRGKALLVGPGLNRFGQVHVGLGVAGHLRRNFRQRPHEVLRVHLRERAPARCGELADDQPAARLGDAVQLGETSLGVLDVPQAKGDRDRVKGVVGEREVQGVPRHERELRIPIGPHLQHAQREVTRDHKCPRSGKWDRRCPGTRGEVEDDLAGQRFDRVHDGFAPPPGMTEREHVVRPVVLRSDVIEHRRHIDGLLLKVSTRHAGHLGTPYPYPVTLSPDSAAVPNPTLPNPLVTTRPIADPGDLISRLPNEHAFAWVRDGEGLVGWGIAAKLEVSGHERFARTQRWFNQWCASARVDDTVAAPGTGPVAFGSFSFDPERATSTVVIPRVIVGRRNGHAWITVVGDDSIHKALRPVEVPTPPSNVTWADGSHTPQAWKEIVQAAIDRINTGEVDKVVLARDIVATSSEPIDARSMLAFLAEHYPNCWTFSVEQLVGATPELLVRRTGDIVMSRVLAGTVKRRNDATDESLAMALFGSEKDLEEHEYAVQSVARALAAHCTDLDVPQRPHVLNLPNVSHLGTDVVGQLADNAPVLALAASLHPTAAVCGTPTGRALAIIREIEGMDRGRYAGPVGWFDANGDGEFGIALRCAMVENGEARAFAGCGIVAGSDPELELAESNAKLIPIRSALD